VGKFLAGPGQAGLGLGVSSCLVAFAEFQEDEKGSITPGKLADVVILSDNIFDLKPEAIRNVKVKTTILGGKVVYGEQ
jgi:predicted amidohydrolase YtcJ